MTTEKTPLTAKEANDSYIKGIHRVGTATMLIILVLTFVPTIYLCIAHGGFPGWDVLGGTVALMAAQEAVSWFLEPVFYMPVLGIVGLYMACTAGNITSMRIPAVFAGHSATKAEQGTYKAEVSGVFALCASVVVNLAILMIAIFAGNQILRILPETVKAAFNYAIPAVYGAVIVIMLGTVFKKNG